jgi:flagellar protein FlgJ
MTLAAGSASAAGPQRLASLGYAGADRSLQAAAQEFESLFLELLLKSARSASVSDGLMDSAQGDLYRDMFDQQMASSLGATGGFGIAELLVRAMARGGNDNEAADFDPGSTEAFARLSRLPSLAALPIDATPASNGAPVPGTALSPDTPIESPETFTQALLEPARRAAATLGVAPQVLLAQAALETGWGRAIPRHPDGSSSHNLFGIKAGSSWQGPQVNVDTLEIEDGLPQRVKAAFRAYDSYEESFQDYARLVGHSPRYSQAVARADDPALYLQELQRAGYATDPAYADKIGNILGSEVMGQALASLKL